MKTILLIEDDPDICEVVVKYFSTRELDISAVQDGETALELIQAGLDCFELVLLDIMLPGTDGFTLCREIRRRSDIPVIFITARSREDDILHGYELGCDDYITKPFQLSTLYAKCVALIKRSIGSKTDSYVLKCGKIELNTRTLSCYAAGEELELPPKQFAILLYLMKHQNWVIDRNTLLDVVWGSDYFGSDRVVDTHIKKLRKALGTAGEQIKTLVGRGYKLTEK
ncbi:MAG: response regulator transcription factor [Ruminococcus sp.]|nr:response regulator transcription factor [Ruminococcus sp.]